MCLRSGYPLFKPWLRFTGGLLMPDLYFVKPWGLAKFWLRLQAICIFVYLGIWYWTWISVFRLIQLTQSIYIQVFFISNGILMLLFYYATPLDYSPSVLSGSLSKYCKQLACIMIILYSATASLMDWCSTLLLLHSYVWDAFCLSVITV